MLSFDLGIMEALVLCKFLPQLEQKEQLGITGSAGEFGLSKCPL